MTTSPPAAIPEPAPWRRGSRRRCGQWGHRAQRARQYRSGTDWRRRCRLLMAVMYARAQPLALHRMAASARHIGGGPSLVDEDQARRVELGLAVEPRFALACDVRPGVRVFLNVRPQRSRKALMVRTPALVPRSTTSLCLISAMVMSSFSAIHPCGPCDRQCLYRSGARQDSPTALLDGGGQRHHCCAAYGVR